MACQNNYGLNRPDKNRVKKMHNQGFTVEAIAEKIRATPAVVSRYIRGGMTRGTPIAAVQSVEPDSDSDEFGPLQGTTGWAKLSPVQKGRINKARKDAG